MGRTQQGRASSAYSDSGSDASSEPVVVGAKSTTAHARLHRDGNTSPAAGGQLHADPRDSLANSAASSVRRGSAASSVRRGSAASSERSHPRTPKRRGSAAGSRRSSDFSVESGSPRNSPRGGARHHGPLPGAQGTHLGVAPPGRKASYASEFVIDEESAQDAAEGDPVPPADVAPLEGGGGGASAEAAGAPKLVITPPSIKPGDDRQRQRNLLNTALRKAAEAAERLAQAERPEAERLAQQQRAAPEPSGAAAVRDEEPVSAEEWAGEAEASAAEPSLTSKAVEIEGLVREQLCKQEDVERSVVAQQVECAQSCATTAAAPSQQGGAASQGAAAEAEPQQELLQQPLAVPAAGREESDANEQEVDFDVQSSSPGVPSAEGVPDAGPDAAEGTGEPQAEQPPAGAGDAAAQEAEADEAARKEGDRLRKEVRVRLADVQAAQKSVRELRRRARKAAEAVPQTPDIVSPAGGDAEDLGHLRQVAAELAQHLDALRQEKKLLDGLVSASGARARPLVQRSAASPALSGSPVSAATSPAPAVSPVDTSPPASLPQRAAPTPAPAPAAAECSRLPPGGWLRMLDAAADAPQGRGHALLAAALHAELRAGQVRSRPQDAPPPAAAAEPAQEPARVAAGLPAEASPDEGGAPADDAADRGGAGERGPAAAADDPAPPAAAAGSQAAEEERPRAGEPAAEEAPPEAANAPTQAVDGAAIVDLRESPPPQRLGQQLIDLDPPERSWATSQTAEEAAGALAQGQQAGALVAGGTTPLSAPQLQDVSSGLKSCLKHSPAAEAAAAPTQGNAQPAPRQDSAPPIATVTTPESGMPSQQTGTVSDMGLQRPGRGSTAGSQGQGAAPPGQGSTGSAPLPARDDTFISINLEESDSPRGKPPQQQLNDWSPRPGPIGQPATKAEVRALQEQQRGRGTKQGCGCCVTM
eukprot:TRINITY_DN7066_c0_g1_i3.p1 TRINITY_DN7066_c0_g1~~TRINITY_DN7066_c0_g1_i3.p1  ORF type:complete len:932 (+),score=180.15 TRINITY_DN7066_c0_g1_i3:87-2882(+)